MNKFKKFWLLVVLAVMFISSNTVSAGPWTGYGFGTPHTNDTFLFGDFTANANKQITGPNLASYILGVGLPHVSDTNGQINLTTPISGTSASFSSLTLNGSLFDPSVFASNTNPKFTLAKTNVTVNTSGQISAGVIQTANGVTINLTNTFVQTVFTNGTISYVDPNGNDSTAMRGVRDYPYATLTNAIAAASSRDTITIMPGSYASSSAKISKPLTINGSGVLNTVITFSTNNAVGHIAGFIVNSANVSIKNMTVNIQPNVAGYVDVPIYIGTESSGTPTFSFNNGTITNMWLENLDLNGASDVIYFFSSGTVNGNAKNVRFNSSFDTFNFYSVNPTYFNFQNCEFNAIAGTPITNNMCRALVANGAITYTVTHSKFNIQNGTTKNTAFCVNQQFSGTPPTFYSFDNAFLMSSIYTTSYVNDSYSGAVSPTFITDLSVNPALVKTSGYSVTFTSDGRYQLLSSVITNYVSSLTSTNGYFTYLTNANGSIIANYVETNVPTSILNGLIPGLPSTNGLATTNYVSIVIASNNSSLLATGTIANANYALAAGSADSLTGTLGWVQVTNSPLTVVVTTNVTTNALNSYYVVQGASVAAANTSYYFTNDYASGGWPLASANICADNGGNYQISSGVFVVYPYQWVVTDSNSSLLYFSTNFNPLATTNSAQWYAVSGTAPTNVYAVLALVTNLTTNYFIGGQNITALPHDPLTSAYAAANHLTDPDALRRLDDCLADLRTMTAWPFLEKQFLFNPAYNPTNHLDLFGNGIVWTNENYSQFGASFNGLNSANFTVNSTTNWTLAIYRRNYAADLYAGATNYPFGAEVALENKTNADAYFLANNPNYFTAYFVGNYRNSFPFASNWNNAANSLRQVNAKAADGLLDQLPPSLWTFEAAGGASLSASSDAYLGVGSGSGTSPLLPGVTNYSPIQRVSLGASTNWLAGGFSKFASAPTTNAVFEAFSVGWFSTNISAADLAIYYRAMNRLFANNHVSVWTGDSMIAEHNNRFKTAPGNGSVWTNCIPYHYSMRHPTELWKDYAQGGSSISTFNSQLSLLAGLVTNALPGKTVDIFADFPRNDLLTTNATNFALISSNFAVAISPWLASGAKLALVESILPATNSINASLTNGQRDILASNLFYGTLNARTNAMLRNIVNRYVPLQAYFYGLVWDTNGQFFAADSAGGFHVEGSNAPIYMASAATLIDSGAWPTNIPSVPYLRVPPPFAYQAGDGSLITNIPTAGINGFTNAVTNLAKLFVSTNYFTNTVNTYVTNSYTNTISTTNLTLWNAYGLGTNFFWTNSTAAGEWDMKSTSLPAGTSVFNVFTNGNVTAQGNLTVGGTLAGNGSGITNLPGEIVDCGAVFNVNFGGSATARFYPLDGYNTVSSINYTNGYESFLPPGNYTGMAVRLIPLATGTNFNLTIWTNSWTGTNQAASPLSVTIYAPVAYQGYYTNITFTNPIYIPPGTLKEGVGTNFSPSPIPAIFCAYLIKSQP